MTAQTVFRLVHIVAGICWVGAAIFVAVFLFPAARAIGPAAAPMIRELNGVRKFPLYMQAMSWLTLLSGISLAWRDAGPLGWRWFEQGSGRVFGAGAMFAIVAMLIGLLVSAPTAKRMGALSAQVQREGRPPEPAEAAQLGAMQNKLFQASRWGAGFLLLAAAAMASARYM